MRILQFTKSRGAVLAPGYKNLTKKAKHKNPATHVIFDLDGTLLDIVLDTENVYRETFKKVVRKYGIVYDNEIHKALVGLKTIDRCKYIVKKFGLPVTVQQLNHSLEVLKMDLFSNTKLKPGAERLVTHLHATNVPMAVATGTSKYSYDIKTKSHSKLFGLFHHIVNTTSDPEVPVGKPDPHIFLVCARRFEKKPDPKECLVFEDSYTGLLAGTTAGMQVVFVPEVDYSEDQTKDVVMIIKSLEDFKPEDFSLPPYPRG